MRTLALMVLLVATPVVAQTIPPSPSPARAIVAPAGIDMTRVLVDDQGHPIKDVMSATPGDPDCARCADLTLGSLVAHALMANYQDEKDLSGEQKFSRGYLAERIRTDADAHLTTEQLSVIKRLIGKYAGALLVVQAYRMLDPNATPEPLK